MYRAITRLASHIKIVCEDSDEGDVSGRRMANNNCGGEENEVEGKLCIKEFPARVGGMGSDASSQSASTAELTVVNFVTNSFEIFTYASPIECSLVFFPYSRGLPKCYYSGTRSCPSTLFFDTYLRFIYVIKLISRVLRARRRETFPLARRNNKNYEE